MDWNMQIAKWVHEKKVWRANATTLLAAVTAVPTVTAGISLYNGEPKGGKTYLALAVYGIQGGTPAALNSWGIVHQVSKLATGTAQPATAPLTTSTVVVGMQGNQGIYGGAAVVDVGLTVVDDRWAPIGYSVNTAVVILTGTQIYTPLHPIVEVPPGAVYSLMDVAAAVDVTARLGFVWAEIEPKELKAIGM